MGRGGGGEKEGENQSVTEKKRGKRGKKFFSPADKVTKKLETDLAFMSYFKAIFISAQTGLRVDKLIRMADEAYLNATRRISTGIVNDVINEAVAMNEPPSPGGRRLKILYSSQPEVAPPHFVIFVNDEKLVHFSYKRYLENRLRKTFDFSCTPIRLTFRSRKEEN